MATARISNYHYTSTTEAYNLWSEVYDTDNNFLQALDSIQVQDLLPELLHSIFNANIDRPKIIDLGCGTGRVITMLEKAALDLGMVPTIIGLDASPGMLQVARNNLEKSRPHGLGQNIILQLFDMLHKGNEHLPGELYSRLPDEALRADLMVSTLVLEHVPLPVFFSAAAGILKLGGLLLVTNMHEDMGKTTQAGFYDEASGQVVRPKSYIYSIAEVVHEAQKMGFALVMVPLEKTVDEESWRRLGPRAEKWIGTKIWFGLCFVKK